MQVGVANYDQSWHSSISPCLTATTVRCRRTKAIVPFQTRNPLDSPLKPISPFFCPVMTCPVQNLTHHLRKPIASSVLSCPVLFRLKPYSPSAQTIATMNDEALVPDATFGALYKPSWRHCYPSSTLLSSILNVSLNLNPLYLSAVHFACLENISPSSLLLSTTTSFQIFISVKERRLDVVWSPSERVPCVHPRRVSK